MATQEEKEGQVMTVTYRISEQNVSESEATELIQSSAPKGFQVENVDLQTKES